MILTRLWLEGLDSDSHITGKLSWMHTACVLWVFWAHASDFVTSRRFLMRLVWSFSDASGTLDNNLMRYSTCISNGLCLFAAVTSMGTRHLSSWLIKHTSFAPRIDESSSKCVIVAVQNSPSIVMLLWVTSFKLFTTIGFSAKAPSYWRWWWQLHMLQQFWLQK